MQATYKLKHYYMIKVYINSDIQGGKISSFTKILKY